METSNAALGSVLLAIMAGTLHAGAPFLFLGLGECLVEKSGRINFALEGVLALGALTGYAMFSLSGWPFSGVLIAGLAGAGLGLLHGLLCNLPCINKAAVGIALMLLGVGLAFFWGALLLLPVPSAIPSNCPLPPGSLPMVGLLGGVVLAALLHWGLRHTRWGLTLRVIGADSAAARTLGYPVALTHLVSTTAGSLLAGIGGALLALGQASGWNADLLGGQGLMAIALVAYARCQPLRCVYAALLFGGACALGPALQTAGITSGRTLFDAVPYFLTLILLTAVSSPLPLGANALGELDAKPHARW